VPRQHHIASSGGSSTSLPDDFLRLLRSHDLPAKSGPGLRKMASFQKVARNVLQKSQNDVVLLSAVRSPINRSFKGGYKDAHPEDILMPVSDSGVE
jgi:hypothetical protein